jgi:hypothetical protein
MESTNIRNRKYSRYDEIDVSIDGHLEEKVIKVIKQRHRYRNRKSLH